MGIMDTLLGSAASLIAAAGGASSPTNGSSLTDRSGTFVIPDVYPGDLGGKPNFSVLPGLTVMDKEVVGCYVKASEGTAWGATDEEWFRRSWRALREVGGTRYGDDWFRGCYHFLRFQEDGGRQADYLMDLVESAGGWGPGDLMPWVDVEEGGQGTWAGGERLEQITDPTERARLAGEVTTCVSAFVSQVKRRKPGIRVGIYGRGLFRDLGMTSCRFGGDAACNPAYTPTMPSMIQYGWPLADLVEWQLCGDGEVHAKGFPSMLPGWGKSDYSVIIDGAQRVSMSSVRRRCLAFPR